MINNQPHPCASPVDYVELYKQYRPAEGYTIEHISDKPLSDEELEQALHKFAEMPIAEQVAWGTAYTLALLHFEFMQEQ